MTAAIFDYAAIRKRLDELENPHMQGELDRLMETIQTSLRAFNASFTAQRAEAEASLTALEARTVPKIIGTVALTGHSKRFLVGTSGPECFEPSART